MLDRGIRIVELVSFIICLKYTYSERLKVVFADFVLLGIESILLELIYTWNLNYVFSMLSYLLIFLYLEIIYPIDFKRNLVNLFFCLLLSSLLQLILTIVFFWMEKIGDRSVVILCINITNCLVLYLLGRKKVIHKMISFIYKKEQIIRIVFLLLLFAFSYLLVLRKLDRYFRTTDLIFFGVWSVLLCCLTISWKKAQMESVAKSKELEVREVYEKGYQGLLDSVRKRQHDFDNQLNALYGQHIYAQTLDELVESQQRYCDVVQFENRFNKLILKGSHSPIFTGFLFSKLVEAEKRGCTVKYDVSYDTLKSGLAIYQLIDIFGILLDNAIEALENFSGEKNLYIQIREYQNKIEYKVCNSSSYIPNDVIHQMVKNGFSTKGINRGVGLAKVVDIFNEMDIELLIRNVAIESENYFSVEFQIEKENLS